MRHLSAAATRSALARETGEVWLLLLEIDHPTMTSGPIYLVNNTEDIVSNGKTYLAFPFDLSLPNEEEDRLPEVEVRIDNVDRRLVESIRTIASPLDMTIKVILASQPDVIEMAISGLILRDVSYDAYTITGHLYAEDIMGTRWPADLITPASGFYGMFR